MARALEAAERAPGQLRERGARRVRADRVLEAVNHEHGTADARGELPRRLLVEPVADLRRDQRLRRGLKAPADAVLDLLRRVRLGEDLREEEGEEIGVIA